MSRTNVIFISALIFISAILLRPQAENSWVYFMDSINPNYFQTLKNNWKEKPTDFLISKINHPNITCSGAATSLLRERPSPLYEEKIQNIINSSNDIHARTLALSILFAWNEEKAKSISMEILRSGDIHPLFRDAAEMLATKKYEPAFPYILEMSKKSDGYNNGSIAMLKHFAKPEAIPVLQDMLRRVKDENALDQKFFRKIILDAIETIKMKNGLA